MPCRVMGYITVLKTQPYSILRIGGDREGLLWQVDAPADLLVLDSKQLTLRNDPFDSGSVFRESQDDSNRRAIRLANRQKSPLNENRQVGIHSDPQTALAVLRHRRNIPSRKTVICTDS